MTNRREFLQIGVTATAWPLVARTAQAVGNESARDGTALSAVVFDTRFADSVAFAERSAARGVKTYPIDGDMTRVWFDEIHRLWARGPAAIAGLTAHGPMFCFAELARDVRMRVVFRAEHRAATAGRVTHAFSGPTQMLSSALAACGTPGSFGLAMADVAAACPSGQIEIASAEVTSAGAVPGDDPLYTWVIAPAVRA